MSLGDLLNQVWLRSHWIGNEAERVEAARAVFAGGPGRDETGGNDVPKPKVVQQAATPRAPERVPQVTTPRVVNAPAWVEDRAQVVDGPVPDPWGLTDYVHCLVWGESGSGKTTFWATFPGPVRCLLCSGGVRTAELKSVNTPEYRRKIEAVFVTTCDQFMAEVARARADEVATLVVDHCGGLQDLSLREQAGLDAVPAQRPVIADEKKTWGRVAAQCKEMFRACLNTMAHVVLVGHERRYEPEGGSGALAVEPWHGVAMTPSNAADLHKNVDYSLRAFKRPKFTEEADPLGRPGHGQRRRVEGADEFCLQISPCEPYKVKFRKPVSELASLPGGRLPDVLVNPTFAALKALIDAR